MATFFWNRGPDDGTLVTMYLTIAGEVSTLDVRSRPIMMMTVPVPTPDFQQCIPLQTVACGPVPLDFLPLTATGRGCDGGAQVEPVPSATSPSPLDPGGPGPWCDILTAGGTYTYTTTQPGGTAQPGGLAGALGLSGLLGDGGPTTPRAACDAAQNSSLLTGARNQFEYFCLLLRSDEAMSTAFFAAAGTAAAIAGVIAGVASAAPYPANVILALVAATFAAAALILTLLAFQFVANASRDRQMMALAQTAWRNAVAAVKLACCPDWITIGTDDLVCS
ncbi:MAG: hypothetical protein WB462_05875 [Solirubrobacterales bacterium]